jgi:CheY-like chemotaxis protein
MGAMPAERMPPLILVVDDDPDIRDVLRWILEDGGYRLAVAADGAAGLAVAEGQAPDLILLDVSMPRLDGPGFCRAYRAAGGSAPIVVVTASNPADMDATVGACGAVGYMHKPFDIDDVLAVVAEHLTASMP